MPQPTLDLDLAELYTFTLTLAKSAGAILVAAASPTTRLSHTLSTTEKDNAVDIVTQTDTEIESFIRTSIASKYPTHFFLGEESYSASSEKQYLISDSTPTWCVDPLDGTVNFTHLFPMCCVSIAFILNGVPEVGVIYAPLLNQMFSARRGHGAWMNEMVPLPLAPTPIPRNAPKGCLFACEWGKDRRDVEGGNLHRKVASFVNLASEIGGRDGKGGMVHGVRSLGSAAMDLAYTAMGAVDIWWEGGCWEWDVAAGTVILEEAGGLVTTANPPGDWETAEIESAKLGGRLYLAVR
ncbi:hypothetical protein OQA88_9328 [Cercophora sp. LCS_1]